MPGTIIANAAAALAMLDGEGLDHRSSRPVGMGTATTAVEYTAVYGPEEHLDNWTRHVAVWASGPGMALLGRP